jgi:hypothetical protein
VDFALDAFVLHACLTSRNVWLHLTILGRETQCNPWLRPSAAGLLSKRLIRHREALGDPLSWTSCSAPTFKRSQRRTGRLNRSANGWSKTFRAQGHACEHGDDIQGGLPPRTRRTQTRTRKSSRGEVVSLESRENSPTPGEHGSFAFTERLVDAGIDASIRATGSSYDKCSRGSDQPAPQDRVNSTPQPRAQPRASRDGDPGMGRSVQQPQDLRALRRHDTGRT